MGWVPRQILGRWARFGVLAMLLALPIAEAAAPARVNELRLWSGPEGTRLVVDLSGPSRYKVFTLGNPDRVVIDLQDAKLASRTLPVGQGPVRRVRTGPRPGNDLRIVLDTIGALAPRSFTVAPDGSSGNRIVVEFPAKSASAAKVAASTISPASGAPVAASGAVIAASAAPTSSNGSAMTASTQKAPAPQPPASGSVIAAASAGASAIPVVKAVSTTPDGRDLVIAVDAGHGGQDPGAIGRDGTYEKHVTLAIARQLADEINREDGMKAVLIRDRDVFVTLRNRISKARERGADLFVSIHADSVRDRSVGGSSVYVLSTRGASDEAARWLAERENAADLVGGVSLDDKNDVLASVLLDVTQKESVSDSVEAASSVLTALRRVGDVHRIRVQHAGFVVLKSPDIPSMLVETAFISNPTDEKRLRSRAQQQLIAAAIHNGIRGYFYENPLPGTRVAALAAQRRSASAADSHTYSGR